MKKLKVFSLFVAVASLLALLFAGCGGSSGSSSTGTGGSDFSRGAITAFGSIVVNDITFDVSGAEFEVDGVVDPDESDLKIGMVVDVSGSVNGTSGVADMVRTEEVLKGPVQSVVSSTELTVLGQTVRVDASTVVDNSIPGNDVNNLVVGQLVEVYGHVVGPGQIVATFIEKKDALLEYKVKGIVAATGATTFTIGALTVDFSNADLSDLPGGVVDGIFVEVEGSTTLGAGGELLASKVERDNIPAADGTYVEIEGVVTAIVDADTFLLGSLTVDWDQFTEFKGGPSTDIVVGVRLEVEGFMSGDILRADEIEFEDSIRLEGDIAAITGNTFTLVELPGLTIEADPVFTDFGDRTALTDYNEGEQVRVKGRQAASGTIVAFEIEDRTNDEDVILQGPVTAPPADPNIEVLGITASTAAMDDTDFYLGDDDDGMTPQPLTRAEFFAMVGMGTTVKLQGTWNGTAVIWDEATIE